MKTSEKWLFAVRFGVKNGERAMKNGLFLLAAVGIVQNAIWACPQCRPAVEAGVYNGDFALQFAVLLLPLGAIVGFAWAVYRVK
ncbi:MAG TPA: hypothetical protein VGB45_06815 [Abditibacterium sp.]